MSKNTDKLGLLVRALVGVPTEHQGIMLDIANKLAGVNATAVKAAVAKALREMGKGSVRSDTTHLRFLHAVKLPATLGSQSIALSRKVFSGYLDSNFTLPHVDKLGADTDPVTALVYEMKKGGSYQTLFSSLGDDWKSHLPCQSQVVAFCEHHRDSLRQDGYGTFFSFQVEGSEEVFVADVRVVGGQLEVSFDPLANGNVWSADNRHRVVVLQ